MKRAQCEIEYIQSHLEIIYIHTVVVCDIESDSDVNKLYG